MAIPDRPIAELILKYLRNQLDAGEKETLEQWLEEPGNRQLFERFRDENILQKDLEEFAQSRSDTWDRISEGIAGEKVLPIRSRTPWRKIAAATVILVCLSGGLYFWINRSSVANDSNAVAQTPLTIDDIEPGSNKAILTLSNGTAVVLDAAKQGLITTENNVEIVKLDNGELIYKLKDIDNNLAGDLPYNTISTPRGGQHKVELGDGTKVWLNAASSIKYPIAFGGAKRNVTVTGEVYFEVAQLYSKDGQSKIPFIVNIAGKGEIEVLGTHFNVNAYGDEPCINTTLLEGSVRIHSLFGKQSALLKPGQQARLSNDNTISLSNDIATDEVMAWKNGQFMFNSVGIETIMRQAARWYDIDVEYEGKVSTDKFRGKISRNVKLPQLLQILRESAVNFKLEEGRKLIITSGKY